jgi:hypothetical protein
MEAQKMARKEVLRRQRSQGGFFECKNSVKYKVSENGYTRKLKFSRWRPSEFFDFSCTFFANTMYLISGIFLKGFSDQKFTAHF